MKAIHSICKILAAVALLAFTMPVTAFSEMKEMPKKEHREGHASMMDMGHMDKMGDMMDMCVVHADRMGLSDEQMAKMKPVHREMEKKQVRFKADIKIAEIELMEIMEVKNFDLEKASAALNKIADRVTAHHLEILKVMKEIRNGLTDEQFAKMKKTMMSMKTDEKKHDKKKMMKK
jgi:Spy/CpxP family protein refolding chaperone